MLKINHCKGIIFKIINKILRGFLDEGFVFLSKNGIKNKKPLPKIEKKIQQRFLYVLENQYFIRIYVTVLTPKEQENRKQSR